MLSPDDLPTLAPPPFNPPVGPSPWEGWLDAEERYQDRGSLGQGGMGEVRQVWDRRLGRLVAMKLMRPELAGAEDLVARFAQEAQATAQLQHPGIVPVHDCGRLRDGRLYFTMKIVEGETLRDLIEDVVHAVAAGLPGARRGTWTLRRLQDTLHRVAEAVGYAHERGVIHRDLKPSNILVGARGEVMVIDWGVARVGEGLADGLRLSPEEAGANSAPEATGMGAVVGTPGYMAPEQARGEPGAVGPWSDVWSLGVLLHHILWGSRPHEPPLAGLPRPSEELALLALEARSAEPSRRPLDASSFAARLGAWLAGSTRREKALGLVARARHLGEEARGAEARALEARAALNRLLPSIPDHGPSSHRAPLWEREDEVAEREAEVGHAHQEQLRALLAALELEPSSPEARAALAAFYRREHETALAYGETALAAAAEQQLRSHLEALSPAHPVRAAHLAWLKGDGSLSLQTEPAGALVRLYRYTLQERRLVPLPIGNLGPTPLSDIPMPMGSYLLEIEAPGCSTVRHPVKIGRQERWTLIPPEGGEPLPIHLPLEDELGPDDVYVPAGWFAAGTADHVATNPMPPTRVWLDGFVIRRFPVCHAEYICFLDALVAAGEGERARAYEPRLPAPAGTPGAPLYGREPDGRFKLQPDPEGDTPAPDWPVAFVDWASARAYSAWEAARTGLPWRLPFELEWEKAARGVDGRSRPWGDAFDPGFCNMRRSRADRPMPDSIHSFPADESPYGLRGAGGNGADWCLDTHRREGPRVEPGGRAIRIVEGQRVYRPMRGGTWCYSALGCRVDIRLGYVETERRVDCGFRLLRPLGGTES